ncbi:MAG: hypothetical protein ACK5M7_18540, partial [Draconibacterium sp.]
VSLAFELRDKLLKISWIFLNLVHVSKINLYLTKRDKQFIIIWFSSNISTVAGKEIMSRRNGLNAIELQLDKSKISYKKDTLGMIHTDGRIYFRNYSSDTVAFNCTLYGKSFLLMYNDSVADIHLSDNKSPGKQIAVLPKSTYSCPFKFSVKLEKNNLIYSTYSGTIDRIGPLAIYTEDKRKVFDN